MPRTRPLACGAPLAHVVLFAALVCAGCASPAASRTTTLGPSPTATPRASQQASATCADMTPGPGTLATFPVPPGTVSAGQNGAAGAGFWTECTPGMTASSIEGYLTSALPRAGWQPWNPQTQNANGCGTEANDYWKWYKNNSALSYTIAQAALPRWQLVFCDLAYGH